MADAQTTHFAKMGEFPLESGDFINMSGDRSAYTTPVAKKGPGAAPDVNGPGGGRGRGKVATGESNGPRFRPQTTICYPNDPVHNATGRGMRQVPSSVGNRDFWAARASNYDDGQELN